jgi:hypothetical protein
MTSKLSANAAAASGVERYALGSAYTPVVDSIRQRVSMSQVRC